MDLSTNGYIIVHPLRPTTLSVEGLEGLRELSFNPERGTGQGNIHSPPFSWLAAFDFLLTVLTVKNLLQTTSTFTGRMATICYADDMQFFASTLLGLQRTAHLVSVFAMVFKLTIAIPKLRAFHY